MENYNEQPKIEKFNIFLNNSNYSFGTRLTTEKSEYFRNKITEKYPQMSSAIRDGKLAYFGEFGALLLTVFEIFEDETDKLNQAQNVGNELKKDYEKKFELEKTSFEAKCQEEYSKISKEFRIKEEEYKEKISNLTSKIDELSVSSEKEISELREKLTASLEENDAKGIEANRLISEYADVNEENLKLKLENSSLNKEFSALKELYNEVELKVTDNEITTKERIDIALAENTASLTEKFESEKLTLKNEISAKSGEIIALSSQIETLRESERAFVAEKNEAILRITNQQEGFLSRISEEKLEFINAETEKNLARNAEYRAEIFAENEKAKALALKVEELEVLVKNADETQANAVAEIKKLSETELVDIRQKLFEAEQKLETAKEEYNQGVLLLEKQIKDNEIEIAELLKDIQMKSTTIETDVKEIDEFTQKILVLEKDFSETKSKLAMWEQRAAEKDIQIANKNKVISGYERQVGEKTALVDALKKDDKQKEDIISLLQKENLAKENKINEISALARSLRDEREIERIKNKEAFISAVEELENIARERDIKTEKLQTTLIEYERLIAAKSSELEEKNKLLSDSIILENMSSAEDEMRHIAMIKDEQNIELREQLISQESQISRLLEQNSKINSENEQKVKSLTEAYESAINELTRIADENEKREQASLEQRANYEQQIEYAAKEIERRDAEIKRKSDEYLMGSAQTEFSQLAIEHEKETNDLRERIAYLESEIQRQQNLTNENNNKDLENALKNELQEYKFLAEMYNQEKTSAINEKEALERKLYEKETTISELEQGRTRLLKTVENVRLGANESIALKEDELEKLRLKFEEYKLTHV